MAHINKAGESGFWSMRLSRFGAELPLRLYVKLRSQQISCFNFIVNPPSPSTLNAVKEVERARISDSTGVGGGRNGVMCG